MVNVIAHEETDVAFPLEQLALNGTNDPDPVRFDGRPPAFKAEEIRLANIGSLVSILSQTVVANISTPKVYYYLNDHLGTPQVITDENGVVVWEAKYRPFGEADVNPYSNVVNNFRLPGQYFDQETGLHYNYFRDYHPGIGRYIEPDPIGVRGGINLFAYASNNPVNWVDPSGLLAPPKCVIPCCENCEHKEVIRNKQTDETYDPIDWYYGEITRAHANITLTALLMALQIPSPPPSVHTVVIGKQYYFEKWKKEKCIEEICKDFLTQPVYFGCKEVTGSEYSVQYKDPEEIMKDYVW